MLIGPFAAGLICVHHLQTPLLRGVLLPLGRWDEWRPLAAGLPFFLQIVVWTAGISFAGFAMDAIRRGGFDAARSMGHANIWLLFPMTFVILFELWRAYGVLRLGTSQATTAGEWLLLAYPFAICFGTAGFLAGLFRALFGVGTGVDDRWRASFAVTTVAFATYVSVFSTLSVLQYQALHVPHGDTGMYEEHLWNLLHGKGFKSELDSGRLFLGERFQVIHLLLIPIYLIKPSLVTLNICETVALGSTAFAVWWMAKSRKLPSSAATLLAIAALAYFPLQCLDQEQSWKTFRPNSFGVPLIAFALAALEAKRYRLAIGLLATSFLAAEDYALVAVGVGAYLAIVGLQTWKSERRTLLVGVATIAGSFLFIVLVMTWIIPHFRGGGNPHYTPYFKSLGDSPADIVRNVLTQPRLVIDRIATLPNAQFGMFLIGSLAFVPLASPLRLAVALPVLGYLTLGEREGMNQPFFHFHAPIVAVILWAMVGGCANLSHRFRANNIARFVCAMAFATGIWFGPSPLSWKFHDPYAGLVWQVGYPMGPVFKPNGQYWRDRYFSPERAESFSKAIELIRPDDRVAATDLVRTRFTHQAACHEYPPLKDHVSIDDIDVIVLDLAEGYWGRGPTNVDRELLATARNSNALVGKTTVVRGKPGQPAREFEVAYHDRWFLVVRRIPQTASAKP